MLALIGKKIGMTQLFNDDGLRIPVSVIKVEPNVVVRERTMEKHGYSAMVLGADTLKKSRVRKPYAGQFPQGTDAKRFLLEFKDFEKQCTVGEALGVEIFEGVRYVDVRGTTKGKGFQGVVRRHKFDRRPRRPRLQVPPGDGFGRHGRIPQDHQGHQDARPHGQRAAHRPEHETVPR